MDPSHDPNLPPNPPDYTEHDMSWRSTGAHDASDQWHQSQAEMSEMRLEGDVTTGGQSHGDQVYYAHDTTDNYGSMFDALDSDVHHPHPQQHTTATHEMNDGVTTATTYASQYQQASANAEISDPARRTYLVDDQPGIDEGFTYASEYTDYRDHHAADEMEMPTYRGQYGDEKHGFGYNEGFDESFRDENLRSAHDGESSGDSEDDDDDDDDDEDEEENSPIEIVAATVPTFDDPTLPCLTFRFWVLGTFFTVLGATVSQLFYFRANALIFSVFFVQLMGYPIGVMMAMALPRRQFQILNWRFSFNPGPFNMKEHMLIGVAVNSGGMVAYAADILAVQRLFYRENMGIVGSVLLLITTQCIGYGMAGFMRRFLVTPANMIWPSSLVQVALYNTLHGAEPVHSGMKRQTFFLIVFSGIFVYQLLPFYIAPILSSMAILCWILPTNGVAQLFGSGMQGLGMLTLSFDWSAIGSFGPLYTPWWAQVNFYVGSVLMLWIMAPIFYFTNLWEAQRFGLVTPRQFDEDGNTFDKFRILDANLELDEPALAAYSDLRMSPHYAFTYGTAFLTVTATLTHVFLYYRHAIYRQLMASRSEKEDIHTRMMRAYPPVPISWYAGLFVTMLVAAIITCEVYPLKLPWWALLLAILVAMILLLPIGIIQAVSNNRIGLNVITEMICGYVLPGKPLPNVTFKVYGYMAMFQCLLLVEDMKLGHYMKVPPRKLFIVQLWGTVVGAIANYGMMEWVLSTKMPYLTGEVPDNTRQWDARNTQIFYSASIIWGAIGPARTFGGNSPYSVLLWFFLIGALLPVPFYLLHKRYPNGKWHLVNIPIFSIGTFAVPQAPANFLICGMITSFIFQFFLYRRHHGWWKRYNYVLSAALDSGTQFSLLFIFVAFSNVPFPTWIGNMSPSSELCNLDLLNSAGGSALKLTMPIVGGGGGAGAGAPGN